MKRPLAVIIITKDPKTQQEIHNRFDAETRFPRFRLLLIALQALFSL
ncbi:MAG TPA: hypothetical protein VLY03_06030 [Bacteroidota bacterium]|nr:hypothetical protein [Bacteroidota bacterium]